MLSISKTNEIKNELKQCFKFAYYSSDTSVELNTRLEDVRAKYPKSIANYERFYFNGMVDLLREQYQNNLEFCYEVDGVLYSTHKDTDKARLEDFSTINTDTVNGFYYKRNNVAFFIKGNKNAN